MKTGWISRGTCPPLQWGVCTPSLTPPTGGVYPFSHPPLQGVCILPFSGTPSPGCAPLPSQTSLNRGCAPLIPRPSPPPPVAQTVFVVRSCGSAWWFRYPPRLRAAGTVRTPWRTLRSRLRGKTASVSVWVTATVSIWVTVSVGLCHSRIHSSSVAVAAGTVRTPWTTLRSRLRG